MRVISLLFFSVLCLFALSYSIFWVLCIVEKHGTELSGVVDIYKHILEKCRHLELTGLMTIGSLQESSSSGATDENTDFRVKFDSSFRFNE